MNTQRTGFGGRYRLLFAQSVKIKEAESSVRHTCGFKEFAKVK
jgi:hypothetical protein